LTWVGIVFFAIIAFGPLLRITTLAGDFIPIGTAILLTWVLPLILLLVAPAKAVSRRLLFLAIGLILLIALNELSKLGLDVTAPKLQG